MVTVPLYLQLLRTLTMIFALARTHCEFYYKLK